MKDMLIIDDLVLIVVIQWSYYMVSQKICYILGNSALLVRRLVLVFSGCLTRREINAAGIVLFKSTIKLNNSSSDKKHNL